LTIAPKIIEESELDNFTEEYNEFNDIVIGDEDDENDNDNENENENDDDERGEIDIDKYTAPKKPAKSTRTKKPKVYNNIVIKGKHGNGKTISTILILQDAGYTVHKLNLAHIIDKVIKKDNQLDNHDTQLIICIININNLY
jgi:hypothetical protein